MSRRGENIRKRKDGRWEGRYIEHSGNISRSRSVYAKTYHEVRKKLAQAKVKDSANQSIYSSKEKTSALTLNQVAEEWLTEVQNTCKSSTFVKYKNVYTHHIKKNFGNISLHSLEADILIGNTSVKSSSMANSIYCVLNQIIIFSNIHYKTPRIYLQKQKFREQSTTVKVLSKSEQSRLLKVLSKDMDLSKMGIYLCLTTGIRLGELCSLKWSDIDWTAKTLYIKRTVQRMPDPEKKTHTKLIEQTPKTACSKREIPLSDQLYRMLLNFRNDNDIYIFNKKKPLDPRTFQNRFKKYLTDAGLEQVNFHTLRHSFATNCIECGADIKSVSELLGHSDVKITLNRYVHPTFETKCKCLNSLDAIYGQFMGQITLEYKN